MRAINVEHFRVAALLVFVPKLKTAPCLNPIVGTRKAQEPFNKSAQAVPNQATNRGRDFRLLEFDLADSGPVDDTASSWFIFRKLSFHFSNPFLSVVVHCS